MSHLGVRFSERKRVIYAVAHRARSISSMTVGGGDSTSSQETVREFW